MYYPPYHSVFSLQKQLQQRLSLKKHWTYISNLFALHNKLYFSFHLLPSHFPFHPLQFIPALLSSISYLFFVKIHCDVILFTWQDTPPACASATVLFLSLSLCRLFLFLTSIQGPLFCFSSIYSFKYMLILLLIIYAADGYH